MIFLTISSETLLDFEKCNAAIDSLEQNPKWNGVIYTFLDEMYPFEKAKAVCKQYNARIMTTPKKLDFLGFDKTIGLDHCNYKCLNLRINTIT